MLLAVIRLGLRLARNLYNHFCFDRVDLEPAVGNFKRHLREVLALVIRELVSGQTHRVGTRVGALRFRGASKREVICRVQRVADAGNRIALDAVLLAVIRLGLRLARNLYNHFCFDRVDLEPAVRRLRNDILFCRVNRALSSGREDSVIRSSIRSLRANGDRAEISAFRRTGKAGNALLRSIISLRLAVRRQLDVLIIVEIDYVIGRVSLNLDRLRLIRYRRVALDRNWGFRHGFAERRSSFFRLCNFSLCSVQIIVYRVSGGVLFIVERQLALVFFEIDGLLFRVTIYKIERIEIFLQGIRRCDLFGVLPHKACLFIRMNQFFSIIIDIFDRINGRKLFNINRSVHVPCIRSRLYIVIRAIVNIEFRPCNFVYIYFLIVCMTGKPFFVQYGVRPNAYITKRMRPVHGPIRRSHSRNIFGFSDGIPSALIYRQACLVARNFDVHINVSRLFARSALHRITIQFHPFRQRPHRQQIDEHQRRHQNG